MYEPQSFLFPIFIVGPLKVMTKFDNENGVSALISWPYSPPMRQPTINLSEDILAAIGTCYYRIIASNSTHLITSEFSLVMHF